MRRDSDLDAFSRIQDLVRHRDYVITFHAQMELENDDLHEVDVESAILTGSLARVERGDHRGSKYVIAGWATDLIRRVGVVAQFNRLTRCVIITVYEVQEP